MATEADVDRERRRVGLCYDCGHVRALESAKGETFYRCDLAKQDDSFLPYPRLPIAECRGFARAGQSSEQSFEERGR
jgi:hypothetical protein